MIVDPDFFDHWRTRMVADMLKDQLAPVYIMRLWAHCQNRKGDVFDIPAAGLKALCQFSGAAQELEDALVAAEYIVRDGLTVTVTGWAEKNAALLAAWENGHKGGRPKKNQNTTDGQPTENPPETHGLPMANPSLTQTKPIRVDKRREEEKKEIQAQAPLPDWLPMEAWAGYVEMRKRIRKQMTPRAQQLVLKSLADMQAKGLSVAQSLDNSTRNSWVDVYEPKELPEQAGAKIGSDEYAALHKSAGWWREAGFPTIWDAMASKCWHTNAHEFRDGQRLGVTA